MKKEKQPILINELVIVAPNRAQKDLQDFRAALQAAESVYCPNRTQLYDLYSAVVLDGHLCGIMNKRMEYVLNKKLYALDKNGKEAEAYFDLFGKNEWRELIKTLLEVRFWGLSGLEFIPGEELDFVPIPRKHIKLDKKRISKTQMLMDEESGIDYADLPNVWVLGKENDFGILLQCSPYALWKRGNLGDWAQFIEIFGQPQRVARYDGYDKQTKIELRKALEESGSSMAIMIPKQAELEIMDGKTSNANGELQDKFRQACNDEMSVIVLGNTETTTSSKSSGYAQSKTQSEEQDEINKSDLAFVASLLNSKRFLQILKSYGYPTDGVSFKFEDEKDIEYLTSRIEVDMKLASLVPMDDDYFYDMYDVPKPANYDQLKKEKEQQKEQAVAAAGQKNGQTPDGEKPKPDDGNGKGSQKKVKLSGFDKFLNTLSDFFDRAPSR